LETRQQIVPGYSGKSRKVADRVRVYWESVLRTLKVKYPLVFHRMQWEGGIPINLHPGWNGHTSRVNVDE
jgi:hypothetical protein